MLAASHTIPIVCRLATNSRLTAIGDPALYGGIKPGIHILKWFDIVQAVLALGRARIPPEKVWYLPYDTPPAPADESRNILRTPLILSLPVVSL